MQRLIKISPDGSEVTFLYDDKIPWESIGRMKCVRASDVVFDTGVQKWMIIPMQNYSEKTLMAFSGNRFSTRQDAVNYEVKILEEELASDCTAEKGETP